MNLSQKVLVLTSNCIGVSTFKSPQTKSRLFQRTCKGSRILPITLAQTPQSLPILDDGEFILIQLDESSKGA